MRHTDDETRRHGARVDLMDFFIPPSFLALFLFLSYFHFGGGGLGLLDWGLVTVCLNEIHTFWFLLLLS